MGHMYHAIGTYDNAASKLALRLLTLKRHNRRGGVDASSGLIGCSRRLVLRSTLYLCLDVGLFKSASHLYYFRSSLPPLCAKPNLTRTTPCTSPGLFVVAPVVYRCLCGVHEV